jgi:hypothetical protein
MERSSWNTRMSVSKVGIGGRWMFEVSLQDVIRTVFLTDKPMVHGQEEVKIGSGT